jgi:hypothetical protein
MHTQVHSRYVLAALFLGAMTVPRCSSAEDAVEAQAQAAVAQTTQPTVLAPSLSPEETALLAIQEEGQRQVGALIQAMAGVRPGPALLELQANLVRVKRDTLVQFLSTRAQFDRARGDEAAALEAEKLIEQIVHPAVPPASDRQQLPDKSAEQKGGRS